MEIGSLPPLPPQEMQSILGNESGVEALIGGAPSTSSTPAAFLDLSQQAAQLSPEQQVQMVQLRDDEALFGGSTGSSPFDAIAPNPEPQAAYDPTQDLANPAYSEPADPIASSTDLWA